MSRITRTTLRNLPEIAATYGATLPEPVTAKIDAWRDLGSPPDVGLAEAEAAAVAAAGTDDFAEAWAAYVDTKVRADAGAEAARTLARAVERAAIREVSTSTGDIIDAFRGADRVADAIEALNRYAPVAPAEVAREDVGDLPPEEATTWATVNAGWETMTSLVGDLASVGVLDPAVIVQEHRVKSTSDFGVSLYIAELPDFPDAATMMKWTAAASAGYVKPADAIATESPKVGLTPALLARNGTTRFDLFHGAEARSASTRLKEMRSVDYWRTDDDRDAGRKGSSIYVL